MAIKKIKKHSMKSITTYSYSVRKAIAPRRRFAIQRTHTDKSGKKVHENYTDSTLEAINEGYLKKINESTYNIALDKLETHIKDLLAKQKVYIHVDDSTKQAIRKFLLFKNRQVEAGQIRYTTVEKLEYEIGLLEELLAGADLLTIPVEKLHGILTKTKLALSTRNKLIILSNSIRAEAGVTQKLTTLRNKTKLLGRVDFLSKDDQMLILKSMSEIDQHITKFGIATGLREGEIFALSSKSKSGVYLHIVTQLYRDEEFGNPKNDRQRLVPLSNSAQISFNFLMANLALFKAQRRTYSSRLRRITMKHLNHAYSIYDLRHTFAIESLSKGLPPITVCSWMGNSLVVFQKHYVGYMNVASDLDLLKLNG